MRRASSTLLGLLICGIQSLTAQDSSSAEGARSGPDLPKPTVPANAKSRIEFVGRKSFSEEELAAAIAQQIRELTEDGLTPARGDDTAYYLGSFYRKRGFASAQVAYEIRGSRLVIKIDEGSRSLLRGITFIGHRAFPEPTLWEYFLGATPERLAKEPEMFPYTENEIAGGADRVRGLYISEGFLHASVEVAKTDFTANGTAAQVTIRIVEGQRYIFGEVAFVGAAQFPKDQLLEAMGEPVNGAFSATKVTNAQRNLESFLKARGYYQAKVEIEADPTRAVRGRVPMRFTLAPGEPFYIHGIAVQGTDRLRADFLPKRFAHLQGELYNPEKLDETFREMLRTGLFKNLRITPTPIGKNRLRLDVTVEEAKAREVGATIGAGSYEGVSVGLRLADRNFGGRGRPLSFSVDYSQRGLSGELLYVDPWVFDSRFNLRTRIYSEEREEEGYAKSDIGWRADLTRKLRPRLEAGVFIEQESVKVTENGIDEALLGPTDYFLSSVGLTAALDHRNDPINPARGWILSGAAGFSTIDGDPAFTRFAGRYSYYLPVRKLLFAFGARAGVIEPIGDSAIPIDVRYFNGGGTTVRSFAERELGPKDASGDPIGGEFFSVLNAEMLFPIVGALQGAAFVDAGNITSASDIGVSDMRYAVGLGLRYKLPIGPLRLDYGLNPSPRADEDRGAFHFSFGFAF